MYTSVRGVDPHDAREPKLASLLVAARWPLQHPSCRHRHRCRLHGPKQSVCRFVDRIERPSRASLTFDAPHTELIPGIPEGTVAGTCWTGRSSSREIVRCPLLRCACARPLPSSIRPSSDCGVPTAVLVPSLWNLTTSTVSSAAQDPGLLHPGTGHGVRWVAGEPSSSPKGDSDAVLVPTSAPPFEGLLLVGSRTPSLGPAPFLTVHVRSDGNRRPTNEPAWTNEGNSLCVSRCDRACATGDGGAFPPFRHHTQASFA
jgi:hypothetical protein